MIDQPVDEKDWPPTIRLLTTCCAVLASALVGSTAALAPVDPAIQRHLGTFVFVSCTALYMLGTPVGRASKLRDFAFAGLTLSVVIMLFLVMALVAYDAPMAPVLAAPSTVIGYLPRAPDAPLEFMIPLYTLMIIPLTCAPFALRRALELLVFEA